MESDKKILVVDDDPLNVELLAAMLLGEGYDVCEATDGASALDKAASFNPDLVLLDVMMPGLNGFEVTKILKENPATAHIPIILITALNDTENKVKGLEAGADDFLTKPTNQLELRARVNSLLKLKFYHDRLLDHQKELEAEVARRTRKLEAEFTQRQAIEAQLVQAQKMEAIGTLAGGIAHDFNNILMSMMGYTELALADITQDSATHDYLRQVLTAGDRARDLVHQILMFSRRNEKSRKPVTINPIVKETLKLLRASLPATIEIQTVIDSEQSTLADPTEIQQIVMNLCTNAAHAMEDSGGTLEVSLTDTLLEEGVVDEIQTISPGAYLRLSVKDTGHGIDPEVLRRIFDPFFTTKAPGKGTGLGLSTVHGIVKSCGGAITVASEPGRGSTFTVFFPVTQAGRTAVDVDQDIVPCGSGRILYIDDEKCLADLGKIMLQSLGYEVTVRCDATEALALFTERPRDFDLVITDMSMPKMTGMKLAEELLRVREDIPIVISTGYETADMEKQARDMGIRHFLRKPVYKKILAATVSNAFRKRPAREQLTGAREQLASMAP